MILKWVVIALSILGMSQLAKSECVNCGQQRASYSESSSGGYNSQPTPRRGLFGGLRARRASYGSSGATGASSGGHATTSHSCTCPKCGHTFDCNEVQGCSCCKNCTGKPGCNCGCPECKCDVPVDKAPPTTKLKTKAPEALASRAPETALDGGLLAGR